MEAVEQQQRSQEVVFLYCSLSDYIWLLCENWSALGRLPAFGVRSWTALLAFSDVLACFASELSTCLVLCQSLEQEETSLVGWEPQEWREKAKKALVGAPGVAPAPGS